MPASPSDAVRPAAVATIAPLEPVDDDAAAAIVAEATGERTREAGAAALAAARGDAQTALYAATQDGELVAVYALRTSALTAELTLLAVAPEQRRRGVGRACLDDALGRVGRRPLVVETDDDAREFYARAGFKLIGKRRHPSGTLRYRLGWHAPRPSPISLAASAGRPSKMPTAPSRVGGKGGASTP